MNRKLLIISVLAVLIVSVMLSSCSLTKSEKIIPEDRTVESIEMLVFNADQESVKQKLSSADTQDLIEMFNNLGYIDRYIEQVDLTKSIASEEYDYMLTIHIAKKGVKKAYEYYVYVGRKSTTTVAGKDIVKEEPKYLKVDTGKKKFKGDATDEIVKLLKSIKENLV